MNRLQIVGPAQLAGNNPIVGEMQNGLRLSIRATGRACQKDPEGAIKQTMKSQPGQNSMAHEIDAPGGLRGGLSLVDRQEPVIQRYRQKSQRSGGRNELPLKVPLGQLSRLELANEEQVPFFPRLDIALKQGLCLIIAPIFDC